MSFYIFRDSLLILSHMDSLFISEFIAISISCILLPCIKILVSSANIIVSILSDKVVRSYI